MVTHTLRSLRLSQNLTQTELGKKLKVSSKLIHSYEVSTNLCINTLAFYLKSLDYELVLKAKFKYKGLLTIYLGKNNEKELSVNKQYSLKDLRKETGLTQEQLGKKLGYKQETIAYKETQINPNINNLKTYLQGLKSELVLIARSKNKEDIIIII